MITNSFDKFPNEPTGLMYEQFGKIGLNPATAVTFEDDFNYATQALADAVWVPNTTNIDVNVSTDVLDINNVGTLTSNISCVCDLGTISDTKWVLRYKVNWSTLSVGERWSQTFVGLSDKNGTVAWDGSQDSISVLYNRWGLFKQMNSVSASMQDWLLGSDMTDMSTATDYYVETIRDGTSVTYTAYSDSDYSVPVSGISGTVTLNGNPTGLQYFVIRNDTTSGTGTTAGIIDDFEFYNGVTSVESASPKVKQHFIEWFSGKQLPSYWTFTDIYATNSGAMVDEVGGGYKITTATGGGNPTCSISFNKSSSSGNSNSNVCQYNYKGSVFNTVMKMNSTTSIEAKVGLKKNTTGNFNHSNATIYGSSTLTNWACFSGDESGRTAVESNIPLDTNWNNHKLTLQTSNILYDINGVLKVTKTDRLPTVENLQPQAQIVSLNTDAKSLSIRYMEVYNT